MNKVREKTEEIKQSENGINYKKYSNMHNVCIFIEIEQFVILTEYVIEIT